MMGAVIEVVQLPTNIIIPTPTTTINITITATITSAITNFTVKIPIC